LPDGTEIFQQGSPSKVSYEILAGAVMLARALPNGRRQIIAFLGRGAHLGAAGSSIHDVTAHAIGPVVLHRFSSKTDGVGGELARLNRALMTTCQCLQRHVMLLGQMTALERVASFLFDAAYGPASLCSHAPSSFSDAREFRLTVSRADIADYVGLTIESVSRAFSELKRQGAIDIERRHLIRVGEGRRLGQLSGRFPSLPIEPAAPPLACAAASSASSRAMRSEPSIWSAVTALPANAI
jgi:CRP/FNR family transcriptional regulator